MGKQTWEHESTTISANEEHDTLVDVVHSTDDSNAKSEAESLTLQISRYDFLLVLAIGIIIFCCQHYKQNTAC